MRRRHVLLPSLPRSLRHARPVQDQQLDRAIGLFAIILESSLFLAPKMPASTQITRSPDHRITRSGSGPITGSEIIRYYNRLYSRFGPQNWWPAQSRLEVIVGAYLTQNTNWSNVEKAIANLRQARLLSLKGLREVPLPQLQQLIRPSGYFRQKSRKLKTFIRLVDKT